MIGQDRLPTFGDRPRVRGCHSLRQHTRRLLDGVLVSPTRATFGVPSQVVSMHISGLFAQQSAPIGLRFLSQTLLAPLCPFAVWPQRTSKFPFFLLLQGSRCMFLTVETLPIAAPSPHVPCYIDCPVMRQIHDKKPPTATFDQHCALLRLAQRLRHPERCSLLTSRA